MNPSQHFVIPLDEMNVEIYLAMSFYYFFVFFFIHARTIVCKMLFWCRSISDCFFHSFFVWLDSDSVHFSTVRSMSICTSLSWILIRCTFDLLWNCCLHLSFAPFLPYLYFYFYFHANSTTIVFFRFVSFSALLPLIRLHLFCCQFHVLWPTLSNTIECNDTVQTK